MFTIRACFAYALYIAAVLAPNILITRFGAVDVAPGPWVLMAPAAVYAVGVTLVARDIVDDLLGTSGVLLAILVGTVLSVLFAAPAIALASGAAFVLSETLDLAIYRKLRDRGWTVAALVSSCIGAGLDSVVFLALADKALPGPMFAFLPGQWVGKVVSVVIVVAVAGPLRRYWAPRETLASEPVTA